uniref:Uncharacterized protein n=1 Tax=Molossus molossus TaxID=27622 RepID=A0A7J8J188_MOLMO|nr:hypothetical protein HJG59_010307 [Molossus molossus]
MPGAEDTKMNKLIVLPQSVKENRFVNRGIIDQRIRVIKKIGSELREQRSMAAPFFTVTLPCCRMGVGAQGTPAGWLLLVLPKRGRGDRLEEREEGKVRVSLSFLLCLESSKSQCIWVSTMTPSSTWHAQRGPASAGWSFPLGSGNLFPLSLQPRSGSSCLPVMISGLPHCVLVGGLVFPSLVKSYPYPTFTIFEYRM